VDGQIRDDSPALPASMVGNPLLSQVRDFIDSDVAPEAADPVGIVRRALRGKELQVIASAMLVAMVTAILTYLVVNPIYQSSGMLRLFPTEGKVLYSDSDDSRLRLYDSFVAAEMQLLTSRPILEAALEHLRIGHDGSYKLPDDVGDVAAIISVSGKKGLISLAGRSGDPVLSAATVNSVIAAYEGSNEDARRRQYDVRRQELASREIELEEKLAKLRTDYLNIGEEHDAGTLSKAHIAKTAQLEVLEERIAELNNTIAQLRSTGGVDAGVGNNIEIQRSTLLDQAMAEMTYERALRLASLETLKSRYRQSHPKLQSATVELSILELAINERRDQISMLGKAGALTGNGADGGDDSLEELAQVKDRLLNRRQAVRSEAADLNGKLVRIRGITTEMDRLELLLAETKRALDEVLVESQNDLSRAIQVVALGKLPNGPIEDKRKPLALGAGLFSSLGTLAFVIGASLIAGRIRFSDDLDARGVGILAAVIPEEKAVDEALVRAASELRTEFELRWPQQENRASIIAVVGAQEMAGVSSLSSAIGLNYAASGQRVLLVDLDTAGNGLSTHFGVKTENGAQAVTRSRAKLAECVNTLSDCEGDINILASRGALGRGERGLNVDQIRRLIEEARCDYDVVVFDLGVLSAGRQCAIGSALSDITLLIAAQNSLKSDVVNACDLLDRLCPGRFLMSLNRALPLDPALDMKPSEHVNTYQKLLSVALPIKTNSPRGKLNDDE